MSRGLLLGDGLMLFLVPSEVIRLRGGSEWKVLAALLLCAGINAVHTALAKEGGK